jgi:hypothetical protein
MGAALRFSWASCPHLVGLARFFSRYCGGVLRLFHVVFSIILAGSFFSQPPESIRFFERGFCCLAEPLLRRGLWRHLKIIALRFHGHGFVSALFSCCRLSPAIALATATPPLADFDRICLLALIANTVAVKIAAQGRFQCYAPGPMSRFVKRCFEPEGDRLLTAGSSLNRSTNASRGRSTG